MNIGALFSQWWAVWRHQRLLWWLVLVQVGLAALVGVVSNLATMWFSLDTAPEGFFALLGLVGALILVSVAVAVVVTTFIYRLFRAAYLRPEHPVSWSDVRKNGGRFVLRLLGTSLLWGLVVLTIAGIVAFFALVLMVIGEVSMSSEGSSPLLGVFGGVMTVLGIFIICFLFPLALLASPFVQVALLSSVMEEELPWLNAVEVGLRRAWRKYGWWLLLVVISGVLSAFVGFVVTLPASFVRTLLIALASESALPSFWAALLSVPVGFVQMFIQTGITSFLMTLFPAMYMAQREAETPPPVAQIVEPMP